MTRAELNDLIKRVKSEVWQLRQMRQYVKADQLQKKIEIAYKKIKTMKALFEIYGIKAVIDIAVAKPTMKFAARERTVVVHKEQHHVIDTKIDTNNGVTFELEQIINGVAFYKPLETEHELLQNKNQQS